jgi:hypothetical protein
MVLHDEDGNAAAFLGILDEFGPRFTMGKKAYGQISLSVGADGSPSFSILNAEGRPRLELRVSKDDPSISLFGPGDVVRAQWQVMPDKSVRFALSDERAGPRMVLATDADGHSWMTECEDAPAEEIR